MSLHVTLGPRCWGEVNFSPPDEKNSRSGMLGNLHWLKGSPSRWTSHHSCKNDEDDKIEYISPYKQALNVRYKSLHWSRMSKWSKMNSCKPVQNSSTTCNYAHILLRWNKIFQNEQNSYFKKRKRFLFSWFLFYEFKSLIWEASFLTIKFLTLGNNFFLKLCHIC